MLTLISRDGQFVADSREIARMAEKRHDHLLRDIDGWVAILGKSTTPNLGASDFFIPATYVDSKGEVRRRYDITRKGCDMVANKMTGEKGVLFTAAYVTKFEEMERNQQVSRQLTRLELIELARESELARIETEKKNAELEYQLRLQEPKVALYDVAMSADNTQPIGTVAKSLGVGPNKLFAFLRDKKVLMRKPNNPPYQEYVDRGYFTVRQYTITHFTSGIENKTQTLVTAKGMAFIHRLLEQEKALITV